MRCRPTSTMPSILSKYTSEPVQLETDEEHPYAPPHRISTDKSNHSMKAARNQLMNTKPTDGIVKGKLMEGIFLGKTDGVNSSLTSLQNGRESVSSENRHHNQVLHDSDLPAANGHTNPGDADEYMVANGEIPNGIPKANGPEHIISMPSPGSRNAAAASTSTDHSHHGKGHQFRHARGHSNSAPPGSPHTSIGNNGEPMQISSGQCSSPEEIMPPSNRLSTPVSTSHSQAPQVSSAALLHPIAPRLHHRHTLEVPRASTSRTSRDFSYPNTVSDGSESGRLSPSPRTPRGSNQLVRGPTRSIHSDMYLDEIPQEGDMARWTETVRQKRASRRKRKEEEEDDRVVVGTKVDMNHVNWVTAYNMLTGIRFTVSRTNAKLDRDLTDADFDARHKFSFDM